MHREERTDRIRRSASRALLLSAGMVGFLIGPACSSKSGDDAPPVDSGVDSGVVDSTVDSGVDLGVIDTTPEAIVDTTPEAPPPCDAGTISIPSTPAAKLSDTGLYSDIVAKTINPKLKTFKPTYELWSDAAVKTRWIDLPECTKIDTTDWDHWVFPVGTRLFKEFISEGKRIETRMIVRFGPGEADWYFVAYAWNDAETDATLAPDIGVQNARGTDHDIPGVGDCKSCHGYLPEKLLGFSAIQLSHDSPGFLNFEALATAGAFTTKPTSAKGYKAPGDAVQSAALGYLHANCGHCHNAFGIPFPASPFKMRLSVKDDTVDNTDVYKTAVNVKVDRYVMTGVTHRVKGGDSAASCVFERMNKRDGRQMPPLATEHIDTTGVATIKAWIDTLPAPTTP